MEYRYEHFKRELLADDSAFSHGPHPGQRMVDFDLATLDGPRLRNRDLFGRPFILVFGSYT